MQKYDIFEIMEDMLKTVCEDKITEGKITENEIKDKAKEMVFDVDMMMYDYERNI